LNKPFGLAKGTPLSERMAIGSPRSANSRSLARGNPEWLVTFMDYDLGYIDLEQRTLQPLDNPFGPRIVTHVSDTAV
jgi:hypothetical protein